MTDRPSIWVNSEVAADGEYIVSVEINDDTSIPLDREHALRYTTAVITACEYAEYDAAVFAQLTKRVKMTDQDAAQTVLELRGARPALDAEATAPLVLSPTLGLRSRAASLILVLAGEQFCQWDTKEAVGHAVHVLQAAAVAPLDRLFFEWLRGTGLDGDRARAAVDDLRHWREGGNDD